MNTDLPFVIHQSGSNAWDCDENGHLNVRYYFAKTYQGLIHLLAELGLTRNRLDSLNAKPVLVDQHVRLHKEVRLAVPVTIRGALVSQAGSRVTLYAEIRHSFEETLFATATSDFEITDRTSGEPIDVDTIRSITNFELPPEGMVKSLGPEDKPIFSAAQARDIGYIETARGTVMGEECNREGDMEAYQYTGRISDAIPNLMASMQSSEEFALRSSGELGGAVVEIRVDYYNPLTVGSRFVILSGLRSFTQKIMRLSHLVFDLDGDRLVLHSQGIAVALDLKTRRAVAFSDDRIERMHKRQLTLAES
jgi:acyl-CoA thioester hydrolase